MANKVGPAQQYVEPVGDQRSLLFSFFHIRATIPARSMLAVPAVLSLIASYLTFALVVTSQGYLVGGLPYYLMLGLSACIGSTLIYFARATDMTARFKQAWNPSHLSPDGERESGCAPDATFVMHYIVSNFLSVANVTILAVLAVLSAICTLQFMTPPEWSRESELMKWNREPTVRIVLGVTSIIATIVPLFFVSKSVAKAVKKLLNDDRYVLHGIHPVFGIALRTKLTMMTSVWMLSTITLLKIVHYGDTEPGFVMWKTFFVIIQCCQFLISVYVIMDIYLDPTLFGLVYSAKQGSLVSQRSEDWSLSNTALSWNMTPTNVTMLLFCALLPGVMPAASSLYAFASTLMDDTLEVSLHQHTLPVVLLPVLQLAAILPLATQTYYIVRATQSATRGLVRIAHSIIMAWLVQLLPYVAAAITTLIAREQYAEESQIILSAAYKIRIVILLQGLVAVVVMARSQALISGVTVKKCVGQ